MRFLGLMGGLLAKGIPTTLSIISDDAGQFSVFDHEKCLTLLKLTIFNLL
jgi:hypothetical protein